jgi:hypothetical protein
MSGPYANTVLDSIHNYFPDLLYNNTRFETTPELMEYIRNQMAHHFNTYNRATLDYWSARAPPPPPVVPMPPPASAPPRGNTYMEDELYLDILNQIMRGESSRGENARGENARGENARGENARGESARRESQPVPAAPTPPVQPAATAQAPRLIRRPLGTRTLLDDLFPNLTAPLFIRATRYRMMPQDSPIRQGISAETINRITHTETDISGQCPICYDDFSGNDLRVINACSHAFHKECIDRWFINNHTCPMCRRDLLASNESETEDDMDSVS